MVKKCTNCGAPAPDDQAQFCNKCGSRIPNEPINKIPVCNSCGALISDDQSLFCNRCGNPVQKQKNGKIQINDPLRFKQEKSQVIENPKKYAHIPLIAVDSGRSSNHQGEKISFNHIRTLPKNGNHIKKVEETRCTCTACGKVWYYGKREVYGNFSKKLRNAGKDISGATCCCWPMSYMNREQTDLDKCPNCGSKAVKKEQISHDVE